MSSRLARSFLIVLVAAAVLSAAGLTLAARPGCGGRPQPKPNCISAMVHDPVVSCVGARNCVSGGKGPVEASLATTEAVVAAPHIADTSDNAACGLDFTPALETRGLAGLLEGIVANEAAARPCRPCKDRPWCTCTFNGMPRVSCDPCCYGNYGYPQVCLD